MSEEIFNSTTLEIKNIFQFLTEEEPSPDDEIEAREKLIELFKILKNNNTNNELDNFIDDVNKDLENWDTLELWFKEVESLIAGIKKILDIATRENQPILFTADSDDLEIQYESEKSIQDTSADLIEIVAQVSEQFKGQIESLKDRIEALQEELDKKTELIEEINDEQPDVMEETPIENFEDESLEALQEEINEKSEVIDKKLEEEPVLTQEVPFEEYKEENVDTLQDSDTLIKPSKLEPPKIHLPQIKITPPKSEPQDVPLDLSEMEDTLKKLSNMEDTLKGLSDSEELPTKPKILPEVVEEEITFTEIPQMAPSDLTEIPKSPLNIPKNDGNDLSLSEIPQTSPTKKSKKQDTPTKQLITLEVIEEVAKDKDSRLTEIPKMVPDDAIKEQDIQKELPKQEDISTEFIAIASQKKSNHQKNKKKKIIITDVIEENPNKTPSSLEGSLFIPGNLKSREKGIKIPDSPQESSEVNDDAIFMLKKPSVKLDDINTESIKTTRTDLYDVFSSFPEQESENAKIGEIHDKNIEPLVEFEEKSKKKKKKETEDEKIKKKDKKKEKAKKEEKSLKPSEIIFNSLDLAQDEGSSIDYDNLPDDKDLLYQDLIALEGKRYSVEKNFKELKTMFTNRVMNENEFRNKSKNLTARLKEISLNITKLRNSIAKL